MFFSKGKWYHGTDNYNNQIWSEINSLWPSDAIWINIGIGMLGMAVTNNTLFFISLNELN